MPLLWKSSKPKITMTEYDKRVAYDEEQERLSRANFQRQQQMDDAGAQNTADMNSILAKMKYDAEVYTAERDAATLINDEMIAAFENAQKTVSGYEGQERRRLFEAKKGAGQVDKSDHAISPQKYEDAQKILKNGADGWGTKRDAAVAAAKGGIAMPGASASREGVARIGAYDSTGKLSTSTSSGQAVQAGRDYQGSGNTSLLGTSTRREPRR